MTTTKIQRPIHQALHSLMRNRLDPEYVAFHDAILQFIQPTEQIPWDPASRLNPSPMARTELKSEEVGSVKDYEVGTYQARVFTPEGEMPEGGWPALLWFHGGGWVMGGLNSENGFLRHVCKYVQCVVITVNYRHAPEDLYPAAIDDAFASLVWLGEDETASALHINRSRLAIGGLSCGGQLAASTALKAAHTSFPTQPIFQLLLCPVIDSTATTSTIWSTSQHAPWLTPTRMEWYRSKYFRDPSDAASWTGSPNYAPADLLAQSPPTFLAVAGCDLLAPEEQAFVAQLEECGVRVQKRVYEGATHSVLVLAGIHQQGKRFVHDACAALAEALGTAYVVEKAPILPMDP